jgi:hypothetical protein
MAAKNKIAPGKSPAADVLFVFAEIKKQGMEYAIFKIKD